MSRLTAFFAGVVLLVSYATLKSVISSDDAAAVAAAPVTLSSPAAAPVAVDDLLDKLKSLGRHQINDWKVATSTADCSATTFDDSSWKPAQIGFQWQGNNTNRWFRSTVTIPEMVGAFPVIAGSVRLVMVVDDEADVWINGESRGHFDWDGDVVVAGNAKPGDRFVIAVKAHNRGGPGRLLAASLVLEGQKAISDATIAYLDNLTLARSIVKHLGHGAPRWESVIEMSMAAIDRQAIDAGRQEPLVASLLTASTVFRGLKPLAEQYTLTLAGYSHIDLAWLWRWIESVQVCKETFTQAVKFFDEFPEFHYSMTQAHAYRWMEQREPALFKAIQDAVKAGRWEIVGGTMVELDCNLPDAESHARQILYGKRYFREKFGVDVKIGWCPDSFGYNGNLPQLLKKGGIDYFVTSKIGWNDTNPFPHHLFWWESPDGSKVLTFLPFAGYTFDVNADAMVKHLGEFEAEVGRKDLMFIYGVGNHGGGPTREEVRRAEKLKKVDWFPKVKTETAQSFFDGVKPAERAALPTWKSELYLEYHRGTYTSQAANKKANRKGEGGLMEAEKLAAFASLSGNATKYPRAAFREAWDYLLFNQMHDILPGSSITPVYRDSAEDYAKMFKLVDAANQTSVGSITQPAAGAPGAHTFTVANTLSFARSEGVVVPLGSAALPRPPEMFVLVEDSQRHGTTGRITVSADGQRSLAFVAKNVPPHGTTTYTMNEMEGVSVPGREGETPLDNGVLRVQLDPVSGDIVSMVHVASGREVVAKDAAANRLQLFEDIPKQYDAWEIDLTRRKWEITKAASIEVIERSPVRTVVRVKKTFLGEKKAKRAPTETFPSSFFTQDYILWAGATRLDVEMSADWWEDQTAMKVAFPLTVDPAMATFEAPFSHIERSTRRDTSFDKARHEVSAQKWADMSQDGFGVSILNDCKYGYDALGNVMRLTLLRSPNSPDPSADRGRHTFTYSIYPHAGDWKTGGTVQQAWSLNTPLRVIPEGAHAAASASFLTCDAPNVIVTTVKLAEDNDDLIVRMFDWAGVDRDVTLTLPTLGADHGIKSAELTGIMEDPGTPLRSTANTVTLHVGAYAIETVRIKR